MGNMQMIVDIRRYPCFQVVSYRVLSLFPHGFNTAAIILSQLLGPPPEQHACTCWVHISPFNQLCFSREQPFVIKFHISQLFPRLNPILLAYFFIFSKISIRDMAALGQNHFIEYLATGFPPTPSQAEPGKRDKYSCIQHLTKSCKERCCFQVTEFSCLIVCSQEVN